ncbi:ubiquitin-like domain-containing CTD phosphatase 1 [Watersipora subatra]|uniref:ubiquitin-like domain-containing CTD phosphatase 1 n=1 Tax=Watersipora subatra TaxID=2589382 RepID=UPI00355BB5EB
MASESALSVCNILVKWSGNEYVVKDISVDASVQELKEKLFQQTGVKPERQKLLGLKCKGKPAADSNRISETNASKAGTKIMMMGTKEVDIETIKPPENLPEVVDDFDIGEEEEVAVENREEYLAKIERRVKEYKIEHINEPRVGKHLLVLDIDYTLFDHRSVAETGAELMRPYLHEFLCDAYADYDIVIWSATNMKWIKAKMRELGVETNPNYKITFYMCSLAMITVHTQQYGVVEVKPLGVVWGKYPHWSPKNTIMFDDIRRNFIMNPQSGLKIRPFKKAHFNRDTDREMVHLSQYLKDIATLDDFTILNHRKWERYKPRKRQREDKP